jgi:hypothetical protein
MEGSRAAVLGAVVILAPACIDIPPFPFEGSTDLDGDMIVDALDRCPIVADEDDPDRDGDGVGDPCDPEPDVDGDTARLFRFADLTGLRVSGVATPTPEGLVLGGIGSDAAISVGFPVDRSFVEIEMTVMDAAQGSLDRVAILTAHDPAVGVDSGDLCQVAGYGGQGLIAVSSLEDNEERWRAELPVPLIGLQGKLRSRRRDIPSATFECVLDVPIGASGLMDPPPTRVGPDISLGASFALVRVRYLYLSGAP